MTRFITLPYSGSGAYVALWDEAEDGSIDLVSVHRELEKRLDDLPLPGFGSGHRPADILFGESAVFAAMPAAEQQQVDVEAEPILQGDTGLAHTGLAIELERP